MKKIKYSIIFSLILILLGMFLAFNIINKKEEHRQISLGGPVSANQITDFRETVKKLKLEEATIEKFKQSQELIVMETELNQSITWDESWGNLGIFKKIQEVNFHGNGIYTTDLSQLETEDIDFDYIQKTIYIKALKPQVKSIELDESKTTYSIPETGLFRFGDIKITPAQNQMITQEVKNQMREKMNATEIYNKALTSAEMSLKDLLKKIISNTELKDYEITIIWK